MWEQTIFSATVEGHLVKSLLARDCSTLFETQRKRWLRWFGRKRREALALSSLLFKMLA